MTKLGKSAALRASTTGRYTTKPIGHTHLAAVGVERYAAIRICREALG
ncbi:hypothetical protein ABZ807_22695 [Micromonospora sp. NPDC047548]